MGPRRNDHRFLLTDELANVNRNARQKTILLCEVNTLRRNQAQAALDESKRIAEHSKKLCKKDAKRS